MDENRTDLVRSDYTRLPTGKLVQKQSFGRKKKSKLPEHVIIRFKEELAKKLGGNTLETEIMSEKFALESNLQPLQIAEKLLYLYDLYNKNNSTTAEADGIIQSLLTIGMGERSLRCLLHIGSPRLTRIKSTRGRKKSGGLNNKVIKDVELEILFDHLKSLPGEEGYACAHKKQKIYLLKGGQTWKIVYINYKEFVQKLVLDCRRCQIAGVLEECKYHSTTFDLSLYEPMVYKTWAKYRRVVASIFRLARTQEDMCDICMRFQVLLKDKDLDPDIRIACEQAFDIHKDRAKTQRSAFKNLVANCVQNFHEDPNIIGGRSVPKNVERAAGVEFLPDYVDEDINDLTNRLNGTDIDDRVSNSNENVISFNEILKSKGMETSSVVVLAQDFGGNYNMPFYYGPGGLRPSIDYYSSNFSLYNFIMSNCTEGTNHVTCYDERTGKDILLIDFIIISY